MGSGLVEYVVGRLALVASRFRYVRCTGYQRVELMGKVYKPLQSVKTDHDLAVSSVMDNFEQLGHYYCWMILTDDSPNKI